MKASKSRSRRENGNPHHAAAVVVELRNPPPSEHREAASLELIRTLHEKAGTINGGSWARPDGIQLTRSSLADDASLGPHLEGRASLRATVSRDRGLLAQRMISNALKDVKRARSPPAR